MWKGLYNANQGALPRSLRMSAWALLKMHTSETLEAPKSVLHMLPPQSEWPCKESSKSSVLWETSSKDSTNDARRFIMLLGSSPTCMNKHGFFSPKPRVHLDVGGRRALVVGDFWPSTFATSIGKPPRFKRLTKRSILYLTALFAAFTFALAFPQRKRAAFK